VVYIETTTDDLIVLNPRWLCGDVLGKLLGSRGHLPSDGRLSVTHLTDLFPDTDVADLTTLLTALELCSVVAAGSSYQLSCRNSRPVPDKDRKSDENLFSVPDEDRNSDWNSLPVPEEDRKSDYFPCVGGVGLVADSTAQLRYVFPRVQHAVWNSSVVEQPTEWRGGIRFRRSSESSSDYIITVQINTEEDEDVIRVICCGHDPQTLYELQQMIAEIVLRVIDTCCPGVYLQLNAISPRDVREAKRPLPRLYSARDVAIAQLDFVEELRIDDNEDVESLKEVLAFGDEGLYARLRPGVELHVSELPMYTRCRLAALLDPPHMHGRDWILLALGLGLNDDIPRVDSPQAASVSRTVCLLALWTSNEDATVRRLLDVVRRTLQRPDVEETLLQLTPLSRPPSTANPERSACPSPRTDHISTASWTHSQRNSRKPSTAST